MAKSEKNKFNFSILDEITTRSPCTKCGKSRMYFCYSCYIPIAKLHDRLPTIKLPVTVDVIKHAGEKEGKSTAVHAAIISPDCVTVYTYPTIPVYDIHRVIIVYPSRRSISLEELANRCRANFASKMADISKWPSQDEPISNIGNYGGIQNNHDDHTTKRSTKISNRNYAKLNTEICDSKDGESDIQSVRQRQSSNIEKMAVDDSQIHKPQFPYEKLIFIDGTWSQVNKIFNDSRLQGITSIELTDQETKFWRPQKDHPSSHLATIEAIHSTLTSLHHHFLLDSPTSGREPDHGLAPYSKQELEPKQKLDSGLEVDSRHELNSGVQSKTEANMRRLEMVSEVRENSEDNLKLNSELQLNCGVPPNLKTHLESGKSDDELKLKSESELTLEQPPNVRVDLELQTPIDKQTLICKQNPICKQTLTYKQTRNSTENIESSKTPDTEAETKPDDNRYDNLLYFFEYLSRKVRRLDARGVKRSYDSDSCKSNALCSNKQFK